MNHGYLFKSWNAIAMFAGMIVISGLMFSGCSKGESVKPAAEAAPAMDAGGLPGLQTGEAPWKPEFANLRERLNRIGLPALPEEGSGLHSHQHLDIFIHGKPVSVPGAIGINIPERFISPVHTHDGSGEIHIESPAVLVYNLGQFFDVWGVRLTDKCIGGYCEDAENSLRVYVNGKSAGGSPRKIELRDKDEIVIAFGKVAEVPSPIPSEFHENQP
jgi:hypothetical protein